jgi:hypothetical protein
MTTTTATSTRAELYAQTAITVRVPITLLAAPVSGLRRIYVDHFWVVTAADEVLIITEAGAPLCAFDQAMATELRDLFHPEHEVRQLPYMSLPFTGPVRG